jgi:cytochrome c oxidase subunit 2
MRDTSRPDLTVKVTGYQWKWGYEYLTGDAAGVKYMSVLSTPRDQIENKAPEGRALPARGRSSAGGAGRQESAHPDDGERCDSQLVGSGRSPSRPMPFPASCATPGSVPRRKALTAVSVRSFAARTMASCRWWSRSSPRKSTRRGLPNRSSNWLRRRRIPNKVWTLDELVARGEKVYAANCAACHQASGAGMPPVFPALDGSKSPTGRRRIISIHRLQRQGRYRDGGLRRQLSDTDIAAVVTYERNAWSNKLGDVIQPAEVKALRGK